MHGRGSLWLRLTSLLRIPPRCLRSDARSGKSRAMDWSGAIFGVRLGHGTLNFAFAPSLFAFFLAGIGLVRLKTHARLLALAAGSSLVALALPPLYLVLASQAQPYIDVGDPETPARLWDIMSGAPYRRQFGRPSGLSARRPCDRKHQSARAWLRLLFCVRRIHLGTLPAEPDMDSRSTLLRSALSLSLTANPAKLAGWAGLERRALEASLWYRPDQHERAIHFDVKRGLGIETPLHQFGDPARARLRELDSSAAPASQG